MNIKISSTKEGIIEYIYILLNVYSTNYKSILTDELVKLQNFLDNASRANTLDELEKIKTEIQTLEDKIEEKIKEKRTNSLSSREQSLIQKGYSLEDVLRLTFFTETQAQQISSSIFNSLTSNLTRVEHPVCYFLGGQPGAGKSTAASMMKDKFGNDGAIEIGIDNYRSFHPNYLEIEDCIKKHWENKKPDETYSPGNDIADFTQSFAARISDLLTDKAINKIDNKSFNIIMEWGMRTPEEPLKRMNQFKSLGYTNIVNFIVVHRDISYSACELRANIMNSKNHIVRRVPKPFHDSAVSTLPESASKIYEEAVVKNNIIDKFTIVDRNGKTVWDKAMNTSPREIYYEYLNNPTLSAGMINSTDLAEMSYQSESKGFGK